MWNGTIASLQSYNMVLNILIHRLRLEHQWRKIPVKVEEWRTDYYVDKTWQKLFNRLGSER